LGFGLDGSKGREEITSAQYDELMQKCEDNVPRNYTISRYLVYLVPLSAPGPIKTIKLDNLTRDKLNRCLQPGAMKYSPAVYIVVEPKEAIKPTEVVESTDTRPQKKTKTRESKGPKKGSLRALHRMDVLLDRLLETL